MADAGWYPDPQQQGFEAFWDGVRWTDQRRPVQQPPVQQAPSQQPPAPTANDTQVFEPIRLPADFGSASWEQQGYAQQGYAQQAYGQPAYASPPEYVQQGYGASPPSRRRRSWLIAAGAVVVLAGAGALTWLVWPSDSGPTTTYNGKSIKNAARTLSAAETSVTNTVKARHGASSKDTRCYFTVPKQPPKGTPKTDVDDALVCGPVLFIDGNRSREYLALPITNTAASGDARLVASAPSAGAEPAALPDDATPVRPDGRTPPEGTGGLTPPTPPAAQADLLTTVDSLGNVTTPPSLTDAKMVGRYTGAEITAAGTVARYGSGDDARSAPAGQKLLAFRWDYLDGDLEGTGATDAQLVIASNGDTTKHTLPDPADGKWVVAAIPDAATAILDLPEKGLDQTLTLPGGKPGSNNVAVLVRTNRSVSLSKTVRVPVRLSNSNGSESYTAVGTAYQAKLYYWAPTNSAVHASTRGRALLAVGLTYTDAPDPGKTFGFPTGNISLRLPDGTVLKAGNASKDPKHKVANVFDVPASFTKGTLVIGGSSTEQGITFAVKKKASIAISIAAG